MDSTLREQLRQVIRDKGHRRLAEPVELASGGWSADFVDGKEALGDWADLEVASRVVLDALEDAGIDFDAIGGPELGACALAVGVAAVAHKRWFFVRKQAKGRGTRRVVEGAPIGAGDRVVVVEDVVTTGGSMLSALDQVAGTAATVVAVVTVVDRGDIAAARFAERGVRYLAMVTYRDLGIDPVAPPG